MSFLLILIDFCHALPFTGVSWHGRSPCGDLLAARESSYPRFITCRFRHSLFSCHERNEINHLILFSFHRSLYSAFLRCLWVWSTFEAKLQALIVQIDPILCAQWSPVLGDECSGTKDRTLAFCTGTSRIYFWCSKEGSIEGEMKWSDVGNAPIGPDASISSSATGQDGSTTLMQRQTCKCPSFRCR